MEMVKACLPYEYIEQRLRLTWQEALFGLQQGLTSEQALVDMAEAELEKDAEAPRAVVLLAGLERGDSALPYVEELARVEQAQPLEDVQRTWLYLVLSWLYDHREESEDALGEVEKVYADFDYPDEIAGFVRYMPTEEASLGTRLLNERRLYDKWKAYLDAGPQVRAQAEEA